MKSGSLFTPQPPPDEFDKFYAEVIEPDVRLSPGGKGTGQRSDKLALAAGFVVSVASVFWFMGLPAWMYGPVFVVGAALVLGAIQLRMGGAGMTAAEIRDSVVKHLAKYCELDYEKLPGREAIIDRFADAGTIAWTPISRHEDLCHGSQGSVDFEFVQIIGGVIPSRSGTKWLGLPIERLSERYTVDGLLVRFTLSRPVGKSLTVSNDRRLADRDNKEFEICELLTPHTGDDAFDADFRILDEWTDDARETLTMDLTQALRRASKDLGPMVFHIDGATAWIHVWVVGDVYELTSLGSALKSQSRRISAIMSTPRDLAQAIGQL